MSGRGSKKVLNEDLMATIVERDNLRRAYRQVKANAGAAGVDGMTVETFADHAKEHWPVIKAKLEDGSYQPGAVRAVRLPKPNGGERQLGIPTVQDRLIQQAMLQVLTPMFEPEFSAHSYGYRPGRSAQEAVRAAQAHIRAGHIWTVDVDISAFFDEIDHDILMRQVSAQVKDRRVLRLIGNYLRAPVRREGQLEKRMRGTPQGGPLSPLLANIYLDALDKELERRGLSFCRYADDVVIFVNSERSGQRVLASLTEWLEHHLKLRVNATKSGVNGPGNGKFLGFQFNAEGHTKPTAKSLERFKAQVRDFWNARRAQPLPKRIAAWQRYMRGWWNYFRISDHHKEVRRTEGWIRRHMRKFFWQRWHNRRGRANALRRLGAKGRQQQLASSTVGAWRLARSPTLHTVLNNARLQRWGLYVPSDLAAN
jgi:group II intron reverse transcriptase/maturase